MQVESSDGVLVEPSDGVQTEPIKWETRAADKTSIAADSQTPEAPPGTSFGDKMSQFGRSAADSFSSMWDSPELENVWDLLKDHLELGLRFTDNDLDETSRPADTRQVDTFLGFINELEPQDDSSPRFTMTILFNQYIGFEYTSDEVAARTRNFNTHLSDGVVEMSGPIYSLILRYPFSHERMTWVDAITPWLGYGKADWDASFDHETWWTRGWDNPQSFIAAGSPPGNRNGHSRVIAVSSDSDTVFSYGLIVQITEHIAAELMWRDIDLTADATFLLNGGPRDTGEFPMKHSTSSFAGIFTF